MDFLNPSHTFAMVDFVTDPAIAALFATFAAGLTQIAKETFSLKRALHIRFVSVAAFAGGAMLHYLLPDVWQLMFDLVAGGIGTTGSIGLAKEFVRGGRKEG